MRFSRSWSLTWRNAFVQVRAVRGHRGQGCPRKESVFVQVKALRGHRGHRGQFRSGLCHRVNPKELLVEAARLACHL
jgi:hypothetical protein